MFAGRNLLKLPMLSSNVIYASSTFNLNTVQYIKNVTEAKLKKRLLNHLGIVRDARIYCRRITTPIISGVTFAHKLKESLKG
jgi:hypothetical protein